MNFEHYMGKNEYDTQKRRRRQPIARTGNSNVVYITKSFKAYISLAYALTISPFLPFSKP